MSGRLFSFYGDDFTGSTDALEALAANAVPSVLFLDPPEERMLERFGDCRAIGVAGESRSRSPEWMSENLPEIFRSLRRLGAPICQYKVCSPQDCAGVVRGGELGRRLGLLLRDLLVRSGVRRAVIAGGDTSSHAAASGHPDG